MVNPVRGTRLAAICGDESFEGFHFCGFGLAEDAARTLSSVGVVLSASAQDAGIEAIALDDHPFFVATAFQPQVPSSENGRLHPLITAFLAAAGERAGQHV